MSSSDKKTIQINPELFQLSGKTRKKKEKDPNSPSNSKIRVKGTKKPPNVSTLKRNILKMIRNHQHDKKTTQESDLNSNSNSNPNSNSNIPILSSFETDFNNSLKFLSALTTDVDKKKQNQNQTVRRYPVIGSSIDIDLPHQNINSPTIEIPYMLQPPVLPKYGCLKNGSLPTYRNWITQKVRPPILTNANTNTNTTIINPRIINNSPGPGPGPGPSPSPGPSLGPSLLDKKIKEVSKIAQFDKMNQRQRINTNSKFHYPKQKRTIRRTYYIGKSRIHPKVSVLVSNKTIRAQTTLKKQELKNIPMPEVKKYLLKHGFIKVGTNSPNDVLREMYENAKLICGEIKNHNPENLLYNYFHAKETDL